MKKKLKVTLKFCQERQDSEETIRATYILLETIKIFIYNTFVW